MKLLELFPFKVLLEPEAAFRDMAAGRTGWAWPLGVYALSMAASALLFTLLPPQYLADSFEGFTFSRDRGFLFYFAASLGGGFLFTLFLCALLSALARFLREGRLSLRLPAAAALVGLFGLLAAAMHGAQGSGRTFGAAAFFAAGLSAVWTARSAGKDYAALVKALLAVSVLALAGDLCAGAAALAGSVGAYTAAEYVFSILSLYWAAKAVEVLSGAARARAAAAVVLAALGGMALLFLALNLRLLPPGIFEALLLI